MEGYHTTLYENKNQQFSASKHLEPILKPNKHLPKITSALIWIYLQIIGKPIEDLLEQKNLWKFGRSDFEKACFCLTFKNAARDSSALEMVQLISEHFTCDSALTEWSKDIYKKVLFIF